MYADLNKKVRKNAAQPKEGGVIKRKKVVLSLSQREELINKLKKGHSVAKLAMEYNCSVKTVYQINENGASALVKYRTENPGQLID